MFIWQGSVFKIQMKMFLAFKLKSFRWEREIGLSGQKSSWCRWPLLRWRLLLTKTRLFFYFLLSRNCDILSRDDVSWRWRRSRCSFTKSVLAVAYELRFSQCFSIILASVATLTFLTSNVSSPFLGFLSHVCSFPISIVIAPQILTNHFLNISFSSLYLIR